ncbi:S8 family peptidase [Hymenobacter latericus]|uniref:S8 family peptidase n=1 Tax=Hymenobacter sp. YIM 151858-1 TaxID=2987688 RepID=UPI0022264188|nr:S8 family peptidase [Hymenobacter sp. YIM 151858-1]UYZ60869.1 S8 family peptidase [Hymenobacter sp. YIM 151858-1]
MKQLLRLLFFTHSWLLLSGVVAAQPGPTAATEAAPTLPGTAVFKLREGVALTYVERALGQLGAKGVQQKFPRAVPPSADLPGSVELRTIYQFSYPAELPFGKVRQTLLSTGALEYVEPLYQRAPLYQPNDPLADSTKADGQYHLKLIKAYSGWNLSKGDTSVVIGITDSGVLFNHQDLRGQAKLNYADPINGIDDDRDGYIDNFRGWDTGDNDNDPTASIPRSGLFSHGTLVTGAAAAAADNGKGVAGVGFKCRFMHIKIYPQTPEGAFGGYEGIVYAADHGCKIINISWGGVGGKSQFEQDVCTYAAVNRDAVLVAAAGNTNAELDFYPASYDHVLSVAGLSDFDEQTITYSYHVGLSAPGRRILTTLYDAEDAYTPVGGSSFAAPLVAGAAGLVRSLYPQLSAAQVVAVLRRSADDIYGIPRNAPLAGRLGSGRLNAHRALALGANQTAVRVLGHRLSKPRLLAGDTARLALTIQNLLQPVPGLTLSISSLTPQLSLGSGSTAALGTLGTNATATVPVQLSIAPNTPASTRAVLRCRFTAPNGFAADEYVTLELNPDYVVLAANNLHLTLTSRSNLGYDSGNTEIGAGITYRNSPVLLSEGGLLVATGPAKVADRLRGVPANRPDQDFFRQQAIAMQTATAAMQRATGAFQDSLPSQSNGRTLGVRVRQRAMAWAGPAPADRDYAIVEYTLRNLSPDTWQTLHAGLFMDWDLPAEAGRNLAAYDSARALGYVHDALNPRLFAGVRLLGPAAPATASYYALDNAAPTTAAVSLRDGFSSAEKFLTLSSGRRQRTAGTPTGSDVSHVVGAALGRLAPNDSVTVAFAVLAAPTLAELQAAADAAQLRYAQVLPTRPTVAQQASWAVFPNPSHGRLQVQLPPNAAAGSVLVLRNNLGQQVRTWLVTQATTELQLLALPAGVYLLQWQLAGGQVLTRRVVLQP